MDRIDESLYVLDQILYFSFFCKNIHDFSMCENQNCNVRVFVKKLISNIKSTQPMEEKKDFFSSLPEKRGYLFFAG